MSDKKTKLTPSELSFVRSQAGRKGGLKRKGCGAGRFPTKTMTVRDPDYNVIVAYASKREISISEAVHRLAASTVKQLPDVKPEGWDEYVAKLEAHQP